MRSRLMMRPYPRNESMIARRPVGSARAGQASAESIPLADDSADAAVTLLTVHHSTDLKPASGHRSGSLIGAS
ncbi:methyltransferase domain-containing protein [Streptomyces sp. NPDC048504]|uniref:methyltransferase domain-containing protein n=1 Tax=Streptomyces sp. NPDC048504 TaxID=3365559 RepID=UPI003714D664